MNSEGRKNAGGRPRKAIKRCRIVGIRFTEKEYTALENKVQQAGCTLSTYLRLSATKGQIIARFNDSDRHLVRQLVGLSNNLNQLVKQCHSVGMVSSLALFEACRNEVDNVLKKLHGK